MFAFTYTIMQCMYPYARVSTLGIICVCLSVFLSFACPLARSFDLFLRLARSLARSHSRAFGNFLAYWLVHSPHVDPSLVRLLVRQCNMVDYVNIKWSTVLCIHAQKTAELTRTHLHCLIDWVCRGRIERDLGTQVYRCMCMCVLKRVFRFVSMRVS